MEITPTTLTAIAGLITAIAALVKAMRGDARKLEGLDDLSPSSAAGDVDVDASGSAGPGAVEQSRPSSANPPAGGDA